ncbi:hypothetical protein M0805_004300 [Coniferiporia weirii]|nr:hypothetical protein M0805_004300 [Coniferiporia weirii]
MQLDPSKGVASGSLASRIGPPLKRTHSQSATALKQGESRGTKQARLDSLPPTTYMRGQSSKQKAGQGASPSGRADRSSHVRQRNAKFTPGRSSQSARNVNAKIKTSPSHSTLPDPLMDEAYVTGKYAGVEKTGSGLGKDWKDNPKSALSSFMQSKLGRSPQYEAETGYLHGRKIIRVKVAVTDDVVGMGDAENRKEAERVAALAANFEIMATDLGRKFTVVPPTAEEVPKEVELSDGSKVGYEKARQFMDYYCRKFGFGQPSIDFEERHDRHFQGWEAVMTVGDRRIGIGNARSKKDASKSCYLDVVQYLEKCDPDLWKSFIEAARTGKDLGLAPKVLLQMSDRLGDKIRDVCWQMEKSSLFRNKPDVTHSTAHADPSSSYWSNSKPRPKPNEGTLTAKSTELLHRKQSYLSDPRHEKMRQTRSALPVYTKAEDVLKHIEENEVTVVMAATGSGKTTQIPQLILDRFIDKGDGAKCNIFCTQPRRLAAISVAHRVAQERGETVGKGGSVGYQVRFEMAMPDDNGSITFCTIGVFLRRMQNVLQRGHDKILDNVTHVIVDEVHERDIDTDLLLVVLKRVLAARRAKGNPLKVILMSATIDPSLFQNYFPDEAGKPAKVVEVPGRSFPVKKHFLDDFLPSLIQEHKKSEWIFRDEKVVKYLYRELPNAARLLPDSSALRSLVQKSSGKEYEEELEIPYPLVALTISHVLQNSESGHALVFLPGWEEIQAVQKILMDPSLSLGPDFNDRSKFSLHVLHSTIPLAEQQVIFSPPPQGVRRIILSTNIAETSVTIPDVVYVVDTAKIKENRYDPERHISSLVSAWVGTSNLNQRAGRAGRHRAGEYYGILGQQRVDRSHTHQTVEMKRMDLSNVVMHVKALDFPNMNVEDVLAATIEPPEAERVVAAVKSLKMVGALDGGEHLTSLGRLLVQLPLEVQMGRLVLYGSFFKCLDQALTLAAILTNRDPFVCPPLVMKEAQAVKDTWCPEEFRSDALTVLNAYNAWYEFEKRGDYHSSTRFCNDNFLSKQRLLLIAKIKGHLLQSLSGTGVLDVSGGGAVSSSRSSTVPHELNVNGGSLPLLAALIAIASQPNFAIRTSPMTYRTARDKSASIHPSSVNHRKRVTEDDSTSGEKQLFAFLEKRQNLSLAGQAPGQVYLLGNTRIDPMTYLLFGAHNLVATDYGLECDDWLPMIGNYDALDDVRQLKLLMEGCMLRVFEGIYRSGKSRRLIPSNKYVPPSLRQPRDNDEGESDGEDGGVDEKAGPLSVSEIKELDKYTSAIVRIMDNYTDERRKNQSRRNSRPATPTLTPLTASKGLPGSGWRSGASTPLRYESRPNTPSRFPLRGFP